MKAFFAVLLVLSWLVVPAQAQTRYTLSGYLKDAGSGEDLIGASVFLADDPGRGTVTNLYGFYSITLPAGEYKVGFSYIGYESQELLISLQADLRQNVSLKENSILINELVVTAERTDENVQSTSMGKTELSVEQIKTMPAIFGEVDILKSLQLLPGVQSAGEGNSGFYVRGGGADQNLILLDEAVVYNTGHLFGFFSVFNSDAIKNTTLIKGGMPAQYGGRLSSVLDIAMKDGNNQEWHATGGVGIISSRLTVEGPLVKDKSSIMLSGRRTYADLLARPFIKGTEFEGNGYFFYDLNAKLNYRFSDKDRLYASGYFGRDVFEFVSPDNDFNARIPWGNRTATVRWNHLFNDQLFSNLSLVYNDYQFEVGSTFEDFSFTLFSGVRDYNAKLDFDFFPGEKHSMKFGANYTFHRFSPYSANATDGTAEFSTDSLNQKFAHELALYVQDEFDVGSRVRVNVGLRGTWFQQVGPYNQVIFDEREIPSDTLRYARGEKVRDYYGLEPRLSARYTLGTHSSLKAGLAYTNQFIHLVTSSTSTLPTDLWVPSSGIVEPQRGIQYSLGYFQNFLDNDVETSMEIYYKDLRNQIEFEDSYVPELGRDIEESFVFGRGRSYGAEFLVRKNKGPLTGWLGYTLSYTWRYFDALNGGERFPARFDRRHDLSAVVTWKVSSRWTLSSIFVYGTGQATTVPLSFYLIEGNLVNEYGPRNGYRLAPYHRMDFSATFSPDKRDDRPRAFDWDLNFSVYNLYNRKNPFFIYYDIEGDAFSETLDISAKQVSLFPVIPSITWNFRF
ncbi:MAG: TonB-dependent receptor plug domain-containing protein [Bacteroidetes bacterium]|nr:TonB-dependent receptor plug domain-containing protein [Bacteroidota bacterium]